MIDEIARTIETDEKRSTEKRGGEKWSKSLIDKLRSYRSLRRHPFLFFFFFPRREAINLQFFQSFVPPFSSFSKTTRPRWFVRSTWGRGRRVSHLHPLATVTWKPIPKSGRIASRQGWRGHGLLSCAILVNSLLLQG